MTCLAHGCRICKQTRRGVIYSALLCMRLYAMLHALLLCAITCGHEALSHVEKREWVIQGNECWLIVCCVCVFERALFCYMHLHALRCMQSAHGAGPTKPRKSQPHEEIRGVSSMTTQDSFFCRLTGGLL